MDFVKRVINDNVSVMFIAAGLLLIVIAILIGVFIKQYWLMAGVNTMSEKEKAKFDLDFLGKYFGLFLGLLGLFVIFSQFVFILLEMKLEDRTAIILSVFLIWVIFIGWYFYIFKEDCTYKKK